MHNPVANFKLKSPFIAGLREEMRALRMSPGTEDAYVHYVCDFIVFSGKKHPAEMGSEEVTAYLSHLSATKNVSASTHRVARRALEFMMKPNRTRNNLLTISQAAAILESIGERHRKVLSSTNRRESLMSASKKSGLSINATASALRIHSLKLTGNVISVQGFHRSQLLHEIAKGCAWDFLEKKYGAQMVKTACADFVRQFSPKIVSDTLV